MANKPNNPSLWSKAKSLAKQKFDVYPSAYANGWAAKWYKGKGGTWRKAEFGMEVPAFEVGGGPGPKKPVKKGAAASQSNPYKDVMSRGADFFRNILPVPDNVAQLAAKQILGDARMSNASLDDRQKIMLWDVIQNAKKRTGKNNSGTEYQDYGNLGYGSSEDYDNWFNRGKLGIPDLVMKSVGNDGFKLASTIGRGRYWTDEKDPETIYYTDVYDWNPSEKNFKGTNQYQTLRNYVRSTEDKNLNADKNENYRMNFKLNKKEIDRLRNFQEMKDQVNLGMGMFAAGGGTDNPGFKALPEYVQAKILSNMAAGGEKMPAEIARARFAAAGNLDKMDDYGYGFGGYIPEMGYGGAAQQAAIAIAMKKAGKKPKSMQKGGEPNGEMALGQMAAVQDKMNKLLQFVRPDDNLDPWIASKLAVMDHSADAISDYLMYGPEADEQMEMEQMKNGGYTVTRSNDRKGKTHKVTGPDGTVKYFGDSKLGQHPKDPERKAAFYARHKKNLAGNPYFRAFARATWAEGGEIDLPMAQDGWVQRAANANLNFWEKCGLASSADNGGGGGPWTGGGRESSPKYKDAFASLADIDNDPMFDKDSKAAVRKSRPSGVDKDMWNAISAEANRLNNAYTNKYFWGNNADPATGRLNEKYLADEYKDKINIANYYRYYNNTPIKDKKSVGAQDIYDYYLAQPGGLETFRTMVNSGYKPQQRMGGYIGNDGKRHMSSTPTWSGNVGYEMGGYIPEFMGGGDYCYECGGNVYKMGGSSYSDGNNLGKFIPQAKDGWMIPAAIGALGLGTMLWANNKRKQIGNAIMPIMTGMGGFQEGGPVAGDEMEVTPEQLEQLRAQGYQVEIL